MGIAGKVIMNGHNSRRLHSFVRKNLQGQCFVDGILEAGREGDTEKSEDQQATQVDHHGDRSTREDRPLIMNELYKHFIGLFV